MNTSDLSAFDLYALHWDERDQSITASFEGTLDDTSRQTWKAPPEHDRVRFHLTFTAVEKVEVHGWSYQLPNTVKQEPVGDRISVTVTGEGTDVRFTAARTIPAGHRTSKAGAI